MHDTLRMMYYETVQKVLHTKASPQTKDHLVILRPTSGEHIVHCTYFKKKVAGQESLSITQPTKS